MTTDNENDKRSQERAALRTQRSWWYAQPDETFNALCERLSKMPIDRIACEVRFMMVEQTITRNAIAFLDEKFQTTKAERDLLERHLEKEHADYVELQGRAVAEADFYKRQIARLWESLKKATSKSSARPSKKGAKS